MILAAAALSLYLGGGKSITTWHGQADHTSVNVEWTRPRSHRTEIAFAFGAHAVYQPRSWFGTQFGDGSEKVRALSGSVLVRRFLGDESRSVRPYLEVSTGPMWGEKQVPAATSRFNFITQPGFGALFGARSRMPVIAGYRFAHISNGGYSRRNPGLGVSEIILGVRVKPAASAPTRR